jgi:hypothetical protein
MPKNDVSKDLRYQKAKCLLASALFLLKEALGEFDEYGALEPLVKAGEHLRNAQLREKKEGDREIMQVLSEDEEGAPLEPLARTMNLVAPKVRRKALSPARQAALEEREHLEALFKANPNRQFKAEELLRKLGRENLVTLKQQLGYLFYAGILEKSGKCYFLKKPKEVVAPSPLAKKPRRTFSRKRKFSKVDGVTSQLEEAILRCATKEVGTNQVRDKLKSDFYLVRDAINGLLKKGLLKKVDVEVIDARGHHRSFSKYMKVG